MIETSVKQRQRNLRFGLFFLLSFCVALLVTVAYVRNTMQLERSQMEQVAMHRANKVNNVLTDLLYKTQTLSSLVLRNNGEVVDFEKAAATLVDNPAVKNVILAPDGVVEYVYPMEGNEKVLGMDYFSDQAGNNEAIEARDSGQLVLGGPFELMQSGQALVGRLPVYLGEDAKFWGIVSVTLHYPEALKDADLDQLKGQGFAFEIWRISPDTGERQIIANSDYEYNHNAKFVEIPMDILNADWYFKLSPIRDWYQFPETWIFLLLGLCISLLLASLINHNYELQDMRKELESLSERDPLTGVLNRRGLFQHLESLVGASSPFVLSFMDVNKFKYINDTHGHHIGDKVLRRFSEEMTRRLVPGKHIFARVGGDEFVLVFRNTDNPDALNDFWAELQQDLASGLSVLDQNIPIVFSFGYALYPNEATDIDDLMIIADRNMYRDKLEEGTP